MGAGETYPNIDDALPDLDDTRAAADVLGRSTLVFVDQLSCC
jgi:hypothetical protein